MRWAVARVNAARVAPAMLFWSPKATIPTSSYSAEPDAVMMRTRSPIAKSSSSAVVLSMTTSSGARGAVPAVILSGFSSASSLQLKPRAGGPAMPAALPSLPMIWAVPNTVPSAWATPSTARMVGSSVAGTGCRSASETVLTPRTCTATPSLAVSKTPSKALLMVSPRTNAPTTKPTPRIDREGGEEEPELAGEQVPVGLLADHVRRPAPIALRRSRMRLGRRLGQLAHDLAVGQEQHLVGAAGRGRLVGDHDDGLAVVVGGPAHEVQQLGGRVRVQLPGGLVGEDDARPRRQGAGGGHPLLLAARELGGAVLEALAQVEGVDHLLHPVAVGLAAGDVQRQTDVLERVEGRHQVERLEDEADLVATDLGDLLLGQAGQLGVADPGLARGEPVEAGHALHQRRLAGPGGAHDRREAPGREVARDAVQGPHLGVAASVDLVGVLDAGRHRGARGHGRFGH